MTAAPTERHLRVLEHDVDGDGVPDEIRPGSIWNEAGSGVDDARFEVEIDTEETDDRPGTDLVPVDHPSTELTVFERFRATKDAERLPIVPVYLKEPEQRRDIVRWGRRHYAHVAGFHAARVPLYTCRVGVRAPVGAWRVSRRITDWVGDTEANALVAQAVARVDTETYLKLAKVRDNHRAARIRWALLLGVPLLLVALTALVFWLLDPWWWMRPAETLLGLVALIVLAVVGSSDEKPLLNAAVLTPRVRKLTSDVIVRAFLAAKLCSPDDPIRFPPPGVMRDGPGWSVIIDLPYSTKASDAMKKREDIAAGLDLDEVQVWLDRVRGARGSARRVSLWVADEDPYATPSGVWTYSDDGKPVSIFDPFPFGQDQRGRNIDLQLLFTSLIIGSVPRIGKTFAARLPALACALDPTVQLHIYDGKGGQDWRCFDKIAYRAGYGPRLDVVLAMLEDLRELVAEMNRRYDVFGALPPEDCPESKITREIAAKLNMPPILFVADEFQRYSEHKEYGGEIVECLIELAKVGPAAGIMLLLATQKPDAIAIPSRLRDVIGTRFALKCMTWQMSETILGSGTKVGGYDAATFQRWHKGVGWLLGADDSGAVEEALTLRTYFADSARARAVCDRAYTLRRAAGTLDGMAAGEVPAKPADRFQILRDILTVWPLVHWVQGHLDRAHCADLALVLNDLDPGRYPWDQLTPEKRAAAVTAAAEAAGVKSRQMQRTFTDRPKDAQDRSVNQVGFQRQWIEQGLPKAGTAEAVPAIRRPK